jgi:hypothetical protein
MRLFDIIHFISYVDVLAAADRLSPKSQYAAVNYILFIIVNEAPLALVIPVLLWIHLDDIYHNA